ncbi:MAG TPA: 23S rRNA (adenine(2503)-C(2))-methyltransferase RlmN [Candidatus Atribacteria bacterium]|nr:23S rRNA (adenine(2503)-C(2))-methyltransferase RlmN [Candidatus Atribacteria bacterium]HPT77794.1 23S rRNA (adenine(2503)-C(2))-methyltransferase RlmN [Candidatus Atribacteria bacterium]
MAEKPDLLDMTLEELERIFVSLDEKPFRARQLFKWLHKGTTSFEQMTDLPATLIEKLNSGYRIERLVTLERLASSDKRTVKYLYLLSDNNIIECVSMQYPYGTTLCLSTQVGCRMGCSFCASTTGGLVRNLTAGEMLAQVLAADDDLAEHNKPSINGLVLMGCGEPLDNYDNVLKFIKLVHNPLGLNIGYRNITLSTCGLVPKMYTLADEGLNINLAVSLHAPYDSIRREIMKIAHAYSVAEVISAARYYFDKTGRRVTFEYALISGTNDKPEHAEELCRLLRGFPCHVNVIPLNEVKHLSRKRSSEDRIKTFISILQSKGINVTRRREMGLDINGACGQLKAAYLEKERG